MTFLRFPDGFWWGTAASAAQTEGTLPGDGRGRSVWDEFYEGDPNIVEVYIGYLRKKVDAPFGRKSIQTVRGIGYRLVADGR